MSTNTSTSQELSRTAALIGALLFGKASAYARLTVTIGDDETASTNGTVIKMPKVFEGHSVHDEPWLGVALLAHEFGHWLQPLKEIDAVEAKTGLDNAVINLLLDFHGESMVAAVAPLFKEPLARLRKMLFDQLGAKFRAGVENRSLGVLERFQYALLIARFEGDNKPAFATKLAMTLGAHEVANCAEDAQFVQRVDDLPQWLLRFAKQHPELCSKPGEGQPGEGQPGEDGAENPMNNAVTSVGALLLGEMLQQANLCARGTVGAQPLKHLFSPSKPAKPSAEVMSTARRIAPRWANARNGMRQVAPGRLDRQAALRQEPVPFSVIEKGGHMETPPQVVICLDASISMNGERWEVALPAAQALTIALKAAGGDVRGVIFGDNAEYAREFSSDIFFMNIGPCELCTSFVWLNAVQAEFPNHRVLVVTDGDGAPPCLATRGLRERTSVILVQSPHEVPWAARNLPINDLNELASAMALLIPRRHQ